jgi:kynurenine formamidase
MKSVAALLEAVSDCKLYDLSQPYFVGMPRHPMHPPFLYSLTKKHGDYVAANGFSAAADAIALGSHTGTHIDGLCHVSCAGKLYGGVEAAAVQTYHGGLQRYSIDTVAPILRRGLLLDIAGQQKVELLPVNFIITPEHLDAACQATGVPVQPGDVVLLRTGWARYWDDPPRYLAQLQAPGIEKPGGHWLSTRKVFAAGSDTLALERLPSSTMPVHVHLLVEHGIHILEALNLEELARDRINEFLFVAVPLKIRGGTGSPIRPLALSP